MKKAINTVAILAALSLAFSALTACSIGTKETETTTTTKAVTSEASQTTSEAYTKETTTDKSEETTSSNAETISFEEILNMIKDFPIGTAGSSAKCFDIALKLINFTENTTQQDEINEIAEKMKGSLNDTQQAMFRENLAEIDYVARKLISGDVDNYNRYIENSSEKYSKGNYNLEKYEAVFKEISKI